MSNIFIKRVAKLLDGTPINGYSESAKPIRASANGRVRPRKQVPSEFELHNQVLHNTWGRIEFEIEPLNLIGQLPEDTTDQNNREQRSGEIDYKVRVKTKCRLKPPQNITPELTSKPRYDIKLDPDLAPYLKNTADIAYKSSLVHNRPAIPPTPLKAISIEEVQALKEKTAQEELQIQLDQNLRQDEVLSPKTDTPAEQEKVESSTLEQKSDLNQRYQSAKRTIRKEFACRESRRMTTLITERKAQAAILQKKSVFANFSLPVLQTLARSPQTPKNSLKWLAFHENPIIRETVAKNKNTDLEILAILARDENESIRAAVAEHPLANKEFFLNLLNDDKVTAVQKIQNLLLEMTQSQAIKNSKTALPSLKNFIDR